VRIRSRPLAELDEGKLALALTMMARRLLAERAGEPDERESEAASPGAGVEAA
jgi:hypothetical protein